MPFAANRQATRMRFTDVAAVHKTIRGIFLRDGVAVSLLCNAGRTRKYPNLINEDHIEYFVGPTTPPSDVAGLKMALSTQSPLRVFSKVASNLWDDLGLFVVETASLADTLGWQKFVLRPIRPRTWAT